MITLFVNVVGLDLNKKNGAKIQFICQHRHHHICNATVSMQWPSISPNDVTETGRAPHRRDVSNFGGVNRSRGQL